MEEQHAHHGKLLGCHGLRRVRGSWLSEYTCNIKSLPCPPMGPWPTAGSAVVTGGWTSAYIPCPVRLGGSALRPLGGSRMLALPCFAQPAGCLSCIPLMSWVCLSLVLKTAAPCSTPTTGEPQGLTAWPRLPATATPARPLAVLPRQAWIQPNPHAPHSKHAHTRSSRQRHVKRILQPRACAARLYALSTGHVRLWPSSSHCLAAKTGIWARLVYTQICEWCGGVLTCQQFPSYSPH